MGPSRFVARDIVLVDYPFSSAFSRLSLLAWAGGEGEQTSKSRPALVLFSGDLDEIILCAITSQAWDEDILTIEVTDRQLSAGSLKKDHSFIKPASLFTFPSEDVKRRVAQLHPVTFRLVQDAVKKLVEDGKVQHA